jgi:hypothetical protein
MASDVYFSNNPSDWLALEGLYVAEKDPPGFIRGVNLNTVGIVGETTRGPANVPIVITSAARFFEVFGGRDLGGGGAIVNDVWLAMIRKKFGTTVVVRVVASDATTAEADFDDAVPTAIINIAASSPGLWGAGITVDIAAATDLDANHFNIVVHHLGTTVTYENLDVTAGNNNIADVIGDDYGNLITVTKLSDGRPVNVTGASLTDTAGSDGTIAAADYGSDGSLTGIDLINNYDGVSVCLVAGVPPTPATVNGNIFALTTNLNDRIWLIWNGSLSASVATVVADAVNFRSDRIVYCYNSPYIIDPTNSTEVQVPPHSWMASILANTDVDEHPGSMLSSEFLVGISRLQHDAISRGDLILLKNAGISSLERVSGRFQFRSAVTTDLTAGKTEITRRRMADFLQLSASERLRFFVKRKNSLENRAQMIGELDTFSSTLKDGGRVIEDFAIESDSVNTEALRAQGQESLLWRVKLIGHILSLVFQTEIGTGVTIESVLTS